MTGGRGPYAKSAGVRERILQACEQVFAESGYRATTVKEIAARAGISERGLVHHFRGKAELLAAVLDRHERELRARVPRPDGLKSLLDMLDLVAEDSRKPGLIELQTTLVAEAISPEHPAHERFGDRYSALRRYLIIIFETLAREGEIESHLSPTDLASMYIALCDGLQLQWLYDRATVDPTAVLRRFLEAVIPRLHAAETAR